MRFRTWSATVLAGALALLVACGGGDEADRTEGDAAGQASPSDLETPDSRAEAEDVVAQRSAEAKRAAAQAKVNPCDLLTETEAEAILGQSVTIKTNEELGFPNQCNYEPEQPGQSGILVSIEGFYRSAGDFHDTLEKSAEQAEMETERVSGLGDAALWADEMLWVLDGNRAFVVGFAKDLPTARAVAEKVLPRL
jgi:hypothetical protein